MKSYLTFIFLCCNLFFCIAQNAEKLHKKSIVIDTHNDVLSTATLKGLNIENNLFGKTHSDIERFKKGGVDVQMFSIFCDERYGKGTAFAYANREIDSLYAIVNRNPEKLMIACSTKDIKLALKQQKMACMMGVEGGHMIEDDLSKIDSLYNRGVRYITLTWNNSTSWATSAKDEVQNKTLTHKGLTDLGKQVVKRMNDLGMMLDLSHVGEQTFYDAINLTTKPVIVSHSCAYTLCPVFRNLKDEQIKAVTKNGGVIHVNFYSGFLDSNYKKNIDQLLVNHQQQVDSLKALKWASYEIQDFMTSTYPKEANAFKPPLSLLMDHFEYFIKLAGIDHVGLGSDFDGIDSSPKDMNGVEDIPKITEELLKRGYTKKDIQKVLGLNFLRVLKANEKNK